MNQYRHLIAAWMLLAVGTSAHAQSIPLDDLTKSDFQSVVKEFSANSMHTSVSGAGTLGDIFGFELGLVGGMTKTPDINKIARRESASADADQIPHAQILGVVTVPLGLTVEAGLVPKVGSDEFKFSSFSAAVKWTPTQLLWEWPVDLAVKGHFNKSNIEFSETVDNVKTNFDYDNTTMGLTFLVSKNFAIFEPYAGFGLINAEGEMDVNGAAVFDPSFTSGGTASARVSSTAWMIGTEVKLLVLKLGLEYTNLFDTSRYTGKLSFYF